MEIGKGNKTLARVGSDDILTHLSNKYFTDKSLKEAADCYDCLAMIEYSYTKYSSGYITAFLLLLLTTALASSLGLLITSPDDIAKLVVLWFFTLVIIFIVSGILKRREEARYLNEYDFANKAGVISIINQLDSLLNNFTTNKNEVVTLPVMMTAANKEAEYYLFLVRNLGIDHPVIDLSSADLDLAKGYHDKNQSIINQMNSSLDKLEILTEIVNGLDGHISAGDILISVTKKRTKEDSLTT